MALPFLTQLLSLALLAYVSGLLMGLSLFRGEIGRRSKPAPAAPLALGEETTEALEKTAQPATAPKDLPEQLQRIAQFLGPAGLLMAGMLAVLILGSMLISWLG